MNGKIKRKVILIILIILTLIIFLFQIKKEQNKQSQEELIFFKLFSQEQNQDTAEFQNQCYEFKVSYHNIDFKKINLVDTVNPNSLIREKIAPRNKRRISNNIEN